MNSAANIHEYCYICGMMYTSSIFQSIRDTFYPLKYALISRNPFIRANKEMMNFVKYVRFKVAAVFDPLLEYDTYFDSNTGSIRLRYSTMGLDGKRHSIAVADLTLLSGIEGPIETIVRMRGKRIKGRAAFEHLQLVMLKRVDRFNLVPIAMYSLTKSPFSTALSDTYSGMTHFKDEIGDREYKYMMSKLPDWFRKQYGL